MFNYFNCTGCISFKSFNYFAASDIKEGILTMKSAWFGGVGWWGCSKIKKYASPLGKEGPTDRVLNVKVSWFCQSC